MPTLPRHRAAATRYGAPKRRHDRERQETSRGPWLQGSNRRRQRRMAAKRVAPRGDPEPRPCAYGLPASTQGVDGTSLDRAPAHASRGPLQSDSCGERHSVRIHRARKYGELMRCGTPNFNTKQVRVAGVAHPMQESDERLRASGGRQQGARSQSNGPRADDGRAISRRTQRPHVEADMAILPARRSAGGPRHGAARRGTASCHSARALTSGAAAHARPPTATAMIPRP